jgi:hypothetical protein
MRELFMKMNSLDTPLYKQGTAEVITVCEYAKSKNCMRQIVFTYAE